MGLVGCDSTQKKHLFLQNGDVGLRFSVFCVFRMFKRIFDLLNGPGLAHVAVSSYKICCRIWVLLRRKFFQLNEK